MICTSYAWRIRWTGLVFLEFSWGGIGRVMVLSFLPLDTPNSTYLCIYSMKYFFLRYFPSHCAFKQTS
jgi:hypothetical protein